MTPDAIVFKTLLESGLPGTKVAWPLNGAPPLPWFTYKRSKGGEVYADDGNYATMRRYEIDLYQEEQDDDVRDAFEECVAKLGPFSSQESWIQQENCWLTSYSITLHQQD